MDDTLELFAAPIIQFTDKQGTILFSIDVLEAKLLMEKVVTLPDDNDATKTEKLNLHIRNEIKKRYDVDITFSQAYYFADKITEKFLEYKKKLELTQNAPFGMAAE